jgi:hypothetical protein
MPIWARDGQDCRLMPVTDIQAHDDVCALLANIAAREHT